MKYNKTSLVVLSWYTNYIAFFLFALLNSQPSASASPTMGSPPKKSAPSPSIPTKTRTTALSKLELFSINGQLLPPLENFMK